MVGDSGHEPRASTAPDTRLRSPSSTSQGTREPLQALEQESAWLRVGSWWHGEGALALVTSACRTDTLCRRNEGR